MLAIFSSGAGKTGAPNNGICIIAAGSIWPISLPFPQVSPKQLSGLSNKRAAAKRATYIIYNYHTGDFWPLLQLQAAVPVTETTPQQPSYFESKSACTWHVVSIYPPKDQMKRIGEKNPISMT